ncbi:N-acetylglucosamine-6-phosphate deacetylase [Alkalimonas amylolytica]|uniref:N-acetylglucosamine 6-phosphate deacetylase n=1 Tax=Alkalimonas amylolytica TaxID=152573 RepID=A0A1H4BEH7_ALKAM|nr:N-acetylglucosamine-6-phosphate deacetylase [Alkalimonas amylolytica]SEA46497.1 N-acetylglucosamine 6-phosphate deacetylase [Alkalimonas amylolytica]
MTNSFQIIAPKVLTATGWLYHACVSIEHDRITSIGQAPDPALPLLTLEEGSLVPGLIDVQVNGGGGVLFNQAPDRQALRTMLKAHAQFGTTAMLPTVITDCIAVMRQAANTIAIAIAEQEPGVLGIHFEGPHLSLAKKGVHPPAHIRSLTDAEWQLYRRKDLGIKVVTLAPETVAPELIAELVAEDVHVCLGHSNADSATVQAALNAGATGFTHLFNGMSPLTSREPGMVGTALTDRSSWCGMILDGHHLHPLAALLAYQAKPKGKLMLVTDAMSPVGTEQQQFDFFSGKVVRDGSRLTDLSGSLAGSVLDMISAVQQASQQLGISFAEALAMASAYPADFLGCADRLGRLAPGKQADLVWLDDSQQVRQSWVAGRPFYVHPQSKVAL